MRKLIALGVVALVMFAASSGISYWLTNTRHAPEPPTASPLDTPPGLPLRGKGESPPPPPSTAGLSPAVRPPFNPAAEELVRLRTQLKDSQDRLQADEKRLGTRKQLLDLVLKDIRSERAAMDSMRKEFADLGKSVEEGLAELERKSAELDKKNRKAEEQVQALKKTVVEVDALEGDRIKQMATMYDSMDPEKASQTLRQMADTGSMDMAAKILASMTERKAARILAELSDQGMVVQLLDKMKGLKRPATPAGPR